MFHGLSKGLFSCDIGLKLDKNPVSPFVPWKEDKVGFSGGVNHLHQWFDTEALHCLLRLWHVQTFHDLSKGLFGCDVEPKLAQNPVSPFVPWKGDKVGFLGRVSNPHEWLDMEVVHCLWRLWHVLRPWNVSRPFQGSFPQWCWTKVGSKPSFAILLPIVQNHLFLSKNRKNSYFASKIWIYIPVLVVYMENRPDWMQQKVCDFT